uniref:Ig-like domain-containing protein n=1 Tax=Sinocyclocheilus anshuiensis TaxID=1608454 RepID=A0A671K2R6_9TELE
NLFNAFTVPWNILLFQNLYLIRFCLFSGLIVRSSAGPLVAPLGSSVVLLCYVDELLLMEGLEVEWRRTDSQTLVHLYQDGESRPERYIDRVELFTAEIPKGNFSLRLKSVRTEDKGVYMSIFKCIMTHK